MTSEEKEPRFHPMSCKSGRGKAICDLLRKELAIPRGVRSFEVRFAVDDVVSVRCDYMPTERDTREPLGL